MRALSLFLSLVVFWPASNLVLAQIELHPLVENGSAENQVNLVIVAEGYTADEFDSFLLDAQGISDELFDVSPYKQYSDFFNVYALAVASNQSGSDHPASEQYKDTYFNSYYDCNGITRLICIDGEGRDSLFAVLLRHLPTYDMNILLVNDPEYGGAGGSFYSTTSVHPSGYQVAIHELGHHFAGLSDEYEGTRVNQCTSTDNISASTDLTFIPWKHWIDEETPLPTPETSSYNGVVGAFEGAQYHQNACYRPEIECMMRTLNRTFCSVCTEHHIKSVYELISPLTAYEPADNELEFNHEAGLLLSVDTRRIDGQGLLVEWVVNGDTVENKATPELMLTTEDLVIGENRVWAKVRDTTDLVMDPDILPLLSDSVEWVIEMADPLPVELTSFSGVVDRTTVVLQWETASETNNAGFAIETLEEARWLRVGYVEGQGTKNTATIYQHELHDWPAGNHAFRLKQIDFDGSFEYSDAVYVEVLLDEAYIITAPYPNPFNPQTRFSVRVQEPQHVSVRVFDVLGRLVSRLHEGVMEDGKSYAFVFEPENEASGNYFIRVEGERFNESIQVTLSR